MERFLRVWYVPQCTYQTALMSSSCVLLNEHEASLLNAHSDENDVLRDRICVSLPKLESSC